MRTVLFAFALAAAGAAHAQLEKRDVHIAVGGKSALYYLPLTITERLGYFKDEGLKVRIGDFPGGTGWLEAVVGGSATWWRVPMSTRSTCSRAASISRNSC